MQGWQAVIQVSLLLCVLNLCIADTLPELEKLRQAAEQGDSWAQLNLGAAYDHGMAGATVDPNKAVAWYRRAAE